MIPELEKQTASLEKTKNRIEMDVLNKQEAIQIEESCAIINADSLTNLERIKKKKKKRLQIHCIPTKNLN